MTMEIFELLFNLLKECLLDTRTDLRLAESEIDWRSVYTEMQNQAVYALPYYWLQENTITDSVLQEKWIKACISNQGRWVQVMHAQKLLIELLEKNGISCVIIKGSAAAMAYPHPSLRNVGDIDVLVTREEFKKASSILENNGYRLSHYKDAKSHHYGYEKDGVSIELHRRLANVREEDEEILSLFEDGIGRRVWHSADGASFPALPDELNGMVLLLHINQHLRSGLGLRHIVDWMVYLNTHDNLDTLLPLIRKTGMEKLAMTITVMCQEYLGLKRIVEESDEYPCDELMDYIMEKGNFGKKSGKEGKNASVFLDMANPVRIFKRLQSGGLTRWKAARQYKVLRPFAWIYQIGSITRELARDKMTPRQMMEQRKIGLQQRNLIRRLGLSLDDKIK